MIRHRRTLVLAAMLLIVPTVEAQPFPVAVGTAPGLSIHYARARRNSQFTFSYNRGYGLHPYYGFGPLAPPFVSARFTQIVVQGPPIIVSPFPPPAFFPEDPPIAAGPLAGRLMPMRPEEEPEDFPPVIEIPKKRPIPPEPKKEEPLKKEEPKKKEEPPPPPPPADRLLPRQPMNPDPRQESLRQFDLGKEAFERGEYGRAAERFRQASHLAPNSPLSYFHLAQAHLAMGNHRRAFEVLQMGLRLQPDWPREVFRPIDLYGENLEDYTEQARLLEELARAMPDDPVILFLTAYQMWFDGRREEARPLFERAAPGLADPGLVERFLQALPGGDIL